MIALLGARCAATGILSDSRRDEHRRRADIGPPDASGGEGLARARTRRYVLALNMVQRLRLYMDDSGTRHPDRNVNLDSAMPDWFALGGILVRDEDEDACREQHASLIRRWTLDRPLHSDEIRNFKGCYGQFKKDEVKRN